MPDPAVHLIVFSKDRPLQLHGMLTSVFRHWRGDLRVDVIARMRGPYTAAYEALWAAFDARVAFWPEEDFPSDLETLLDGPGAKGAAYTCFGCDDVVYTAPVDVAAVGSAFRDEPALLGLSLRLGQNTEADMFGRPMAQPAFAHPTPPAFEEDAWADAAERRLQWDASAAAGDWGYPWEVLGTVYPTDYVRATVAALVARGQVQNPSTLEDAGWRRWRECAGERHLLQSFARSRLVVPTVNLVQSVFGNGIVGAAGLDPEFLLDCWNRGLRMDVERYRGLPSHSWRVGDFHLLRVA